jgi:hypothetical protein
MTTADRERLSSIRERAKAARKRRSQLSEALTLAQRAGDTDAAGIAPDQLSRVEAELSQAEGLEKVLLSNLAGVTGDGGSGFGGFLDSPDTVRALEQWGHSAAPIGSVNLGPVSTAAELVGRMQGGDFGGGRTMAASPAGTRVCRTRRGTDLYRV